MSGLDILDLFKIKPEYELTKLKKNAKIKLIDSMLDTSAGPAKGLIVTLDISASMRNINNRIYTVNGQKRGVDSWTQPYAKPMIKNHDIEQDAVGRFIDVVQDWNSEATKFFKNAAEYEKFKLEALSDSPERIAKALYKHKLVDNKEWKGLTTLVGKVRVTDKDAIEKFLDERYLTFSSGAITDRYVCSICMSDWGQGDICDHKPGTVYDGERAFHITGTYLGKEISILNNPAYSFSFVKSLSLEDSGEGVNINIENVNTEIEPYLMDSNIDLGVDMKNFNLMDERKLILDVWEDESLGQELVDSLDGETHYETSWLIKVHDALHQSYDWQVRWSSKDEPKEIPVGVFKLHAKLHALADAGGWRDSIQNGHLDSYDEVGADSDVFKLQVVPEPKDDNNSEPMITDAEPVGALVVDEPAVNDSEEPAVDWLILDLALNGLAGALSVEDASALDPKLVLGPSGLFVVADEDRLAKAEELINKVQLTDVARTLILGKVEEARKVLDGLSCGCKKCACGKVKDIQDNYKQLLVDFSTTKEELEDLRKKLDSKNEEVENINRSVIDSVQPVSNPSQVSSQVLLDEKDKKLGKFEQNIVNIYKQTFDSQGEIAALTFLKSKSRYLPKNFNIQDYI